MSVTALVEFVSLEGNVPIMLALFRQKMCYAKELEHELGSHPMTVLRSLDYLMSRGLVEVIQPGGEDARIKRYFTLTDDGREIAACMVQCQKKIRRVLERERERVSRCQTIR